jgi:AcrR family transcriptional regulator
MCPAPAKTSDREIVDAAQRIVAEHGPHALSMQGVADEVGVRAPSLYKRFPSRDALLDALAERAIAELAARISKAGRALTRADLLRAMAKSYRDFAKRNPQLYRLLYMRREESAELVAARARAVAPLLEALSTLVARPEERLPAARMLTAFLHGFVSMEIDGAFKLGGDVSQAFEYALDKLTQSLVPEGVTTRARRDRP